MLLNAGGTAFDDEATGADQRYDQTAEQDLRETFKRFEPTARDGERITRLLVKRRAQHRARHPQLPGVLDRARRPRPRARRARRLGQRELRGVRVRGHGAARGAAAVPGRARPDDADARQDDRAGGRARPDARRPAAVRAQPRAGAAQDPALLPRDHADHPRPDPPVRARRPAERAQPAQRDQGARRRDAAAHDELQGPQQVLQRVRLRPARRGPVVPVLERLGGAQRRHPVRPAGRPRAGAPRPRPALLLGLRDARVGGRGQPAARHDHAPQQLPARAGRLPAERQDNRVP